jgi:hypothetical protein
MENTRQLSAIGWRKYCICDCVGGAHQQGILMDSGYIAIGLLLTERSNDDDSHRGYLEHKSLHTMANKRQCLPKECPVVRSPKYILLGMSKSFCNYYHITVVLGVHYDISHVRFLLFILHKSN